jgi:ABC-type bacteriocin/lantibiotic exporter with double-glycine peptidase domain
MSIKLQVPLVKQELSMECWYASACMVAYFFEAGPRLGLPEKWRANKGINPNLGDFTALAKAEGLAAVPSASQVWTEAALEKLLKESGPIWSAGVWYGNKHIVVLTGVDNGSVYINDPDGPAAKSHPLAWYNDKLAKTVAGCMMVRQKK